MMMMNPSQKLTPPRRGAPSKADDLGHAIAALKRMFVGGKGIDVRTLGDQVEISAKAGVGGRIASGGSVQVDYTAASKVRLEEYTGVVDYARGRVTDGADKGVAYIRNPNNDGWDAINRLE